jgi:aspartyl-tRNA(Asn)/glutamyl-tRNA(Gln) amidotransferase subunit C
MATERATPEDVKRLADLSRIAIPEADLERFAKGFDAILEYVGKLEELTLPMGNTRVLPAVRNVLREDGEPHTPGIYTESIVAQFPEREGNSLSVKQIISND